MTAYIIISIMAYVIGSINFSIIISKKVAGFDVREKGSGNAGTTNVLRSVGLKAGLITLVCDILKGVVSILLAMLVGYIIKDIDKALLVQLAGIFVIIGHTFPIFFGFKGGKGVATSLGVLLITNWQIALICMIFALVIILISRMVSMGSVGASILFPVLTIFINEHFIVEGAGFKYFIYSLLIALIVIFNHRENIKRILNGTENKFSIGNSSK